MFSRRKGAKRFSLLLLEEEEDYVQDWVVTCRWPNNVDGNWQGLRQLSGRVRLCTKSLFFEPDDVRIPIARLAFSGVQQLAPEASAATFGISVNHVTKMRANMEEVPYVFERGKVSHWSFTLLYAPLDGFMMAAQELLAIGRLPRAERTFLLEALVRRGEDAAVFDTSRLIDFGERLLYEGAVVQLTPLVKERGHLVITDARIYFQPLHNVAGDVPVRSHPLAAVAAVARRRSSLRPIGLELFFITADVSARASGEGGHHLPLGPVWDAPSAFFAFRTELERECAAAIISSQPELGRAAPSSAVEGVLAAKGMLLEAAGVWLRRVTAAWQHAKISNFDYLLYLNFAAGRSFNDLAQWPVFPWVLSNYTSHELDLADPANYRNLSKPVGALNPARLADFRRRFQDMPADDMMEGAVPPFMYGTHYSSPGYVMYWLVRAAPSHMLRLQNGRFDAPDRLFFGIKESWDSVLSSSTDVKELIPEFYLPNAEFLVNLASLPLGVRQSGHAVADVDLPPWAHSPADFLAKNRAALESPPVSAQLHCWIDLIFGAKQCGPAAVAADNLFYHLTYEGAVDIGRVADPMELKALETQINEFGQTPKQLFTQLHPPRIACPPPPDPRTVFGEATPSISGVGAGSFMPPPSMTAQPGPYSSFTAVPPALHGLRPGSIGGGTPAGMRGDAGGDAGLRALALALLTTIIAAAAPEFADVAAEAEVAMDEVSSACAAGNAAHCVTGSGLKAVPAEPQPVSTGSSGSGGLSSLYGSFLKLGRYTKKQQPQVVTPPAHNGAQPSQIPAPGGVEAPLGHHAAGDGRTGGPSDGTSGCPADLPWEPAPRPEPSTTPAAPVDHSRPGLAVPIRPGSRQPGSPHQPASPARRCHSPLSTLRPAAAGGSQASRSSAGVCCRASSHAFEAAAAGPPARHGSGRCGWAPGLVERLPTAQHLSVRLQREALTAVAFDPAARQGGGDPRPGAVYVAGAGGLLKALSVADASVLRSGQLSGDLLCLATLPGTRASSTATGTSRAHPPLLVGTHNRQLLAYDLDRCHMMGACSAHDDAVCCVVTAGGSGSDGGSADCVVTASWDCSVKLWSLAEGREPWGGGGRYRFPVTELRDFDAGVWALDVEGSTGSTAPGMHGVGVLVAGTEEGGVSCWDARAGTRAWQVQIGEDYIGGLQLTPCGRYVLVAAADGSLSLIDRRMAERDAQLLAQVACGASLRCCATDGRLAIAGDESGSVQTWNIGWLTSQSATHSLSLDQEAEGLYVAWNTRGGSSINAIDVCNGIDGVVHLALAQESGELMLMHCGGASGTQDAGVMPP